MNLSKESTIHQKSELDQLRTIGNLIRRKWVYFVITLAITFTAAYLYNNYTLPTYRTSASLLIEEGIKPVSTSDDQLLEGFGLTMSLKNMDNQMMILSSRNLIRETINNLPLEKDYYVKKLFKQKSFYTDHPVELIPDDPEKFPKDVEFIIKSINGQSFKLDTKKGNPLQIHTVGTFGKRIQTKGISFRIDLLEKNWFAENTRLFFTWHSQENLVNYFSSRMVIEPASKKGTVVLINLDGTNRRMDMEFMNSYLENFLNMSLEKKNTKALRTINFIDEQLIGISDSLVITEEKLQEFRSRNRVMDLSAQGQSIIDQAVLLENELARRKIEADYYSYLSEYLNNNESSAILTAPATLGITDPGLTKLVENLADLQAQYYSQSLGEKNPMQNLLNQRIRNTKEALSETLKGVIRANNLALADIRKQIRSLNAQASALPVTERKLLGIERRYELNNDLYNYLMEKRAQAQIQKASNTADNEIIDMPNTGSGPLKPRIPVNYMIALFTGLALPFLILRSSEAFNRKIRDIKEIQGVSNIPISGYIPHNANTDNLLILNKLNIPNIEAFRALRTRIQFFTKEIKSPIILITSSIPDEGKTTVATNLGFVYSLLNEKTIIVDFDLRAGIIHSLFGLENDAGISTWLIGKNKIEEVIQKTGFENLDVLPSGPFPPNPCELASLLKTGHLLDILRERYDYIVIDTPPVGIFSDGFHIASMSDTNLVVVRQNQSIKDHLMATLDDLRSNKIESVSIVFNDLELNQYQYGYARKYRYAYSKQTTNANSKRKKTMNL